MPSRFLDTNILLRYFTRDDQGKAEKALALLTRIERGEERVKTSPLVIFETVFTLQSFYHVPKARIKELLLPVIRLSGLRLPLKNCCLDALEIYVDNNISFADAFTAAYMKANGMTEVYSWDTDFDKLEGVVRFEP